MVNPFYVQPAQSDLSPVLQGIGAIAKGARETNQANAKQKAFMEAAQSGDPTQMTALVAKYPELSQAARDQFGITNEASGAVALDTYQRVLADPSRASEYLSAGIEQVRAAGGRPDMMTSDLQMFQQDPETALQKIRMGYAMFGGDKPAGMQEFESLTEGFTEEEIERARRIKAGLAPRAVGSSSLTITDEGRAEDVAETQATIKGREERAKLAENLKFKPQIEKAVINAKKMAEERGEVFTDLSRAKAALPALETTVSELRELAPIATSTLSGKVFDTAAKELGFGGTKGATARAKFIAIIDNQVLPLLKPTFGAAFTVEEGNALRATLGDPDSSPEEKMAQLDAFIAQKMRDIETKESQLQQGQPSELTPEEQAELQALEAELGNR